jgi:hypothetical protein
MTTTSEAKTTRARKIGTVELLQLRILPLDAEMGHDPRATTVYVDPGTFDVYRRFDVTYWMLKGFINKRGFEKLGDGLFAMHGSDGPSDVEVVFPSKGFGPEEFDDFLSEPICQEGAPAQRYRFQIEQAEVSA